MTKLEADYLVVGAGATGMAFADALVEHSDATVVMVDRRHAAGGHWLSAYPFVRLHQASQFYGVASTLLGNGRVQRTGPEAGLHERATAPEICGYYDHVLGEKLVGSGRVDFHPGCEYLGERRFTSHVSGRTFEVDVRRKVVDARYLAPRIPADTSPPFVVEEGARVVTVNDLPRLTDVPSQYVVVGAGKTAADACVWLLENGVDADAICWVRPRDPWFYNRATIQPDPAVVVGMLADVMESASTASDADDLFRRLEDRGVVLRIDPSVTPTMAKTPTLATWELELLRTVGNVVRLGHLRAVEPGRLRLDAGDVRVAPDAVVVHAAAEGLRYPPLVPIWGPGSITIQTIRAGFPCFAAALTGFVEATIDDDDVKNVLCPPTPYPDTPTTWIRMQSLGYRAAKSFMSHPEIAAWAGAAAINPAALPRGTDRTAAYDLARQRLAEHEAAGLARLGELAGAPG